MTFHGQVWPWKFHGMKFQTGPTLEASCRPAYGTTLLKKWSFFDHFWHFFVEIFHFWKISSAGHMIFAKFFRKNLRQAEKNSKKWKFFTFFTLFLSAFSLEWLHIPRPGGLNGLTAKRFGAFRSSQVRLSWVAPGPTSTPVAPRLNKINNFNSGVFFFCGRRPRGRRPPLN